MTLLERTKIQAEVLVPIVKALESELGTDHARRLVRDAIGDHIRETAQTSWKPGSGRDAIEKLLHISKAGDVQTHEPVDSTDDELNVDVTRCGFAEFFHQLGEPELGFLLVCSLDDDYVAGLDDVDMSRTQTIMQGASHCDFRFRFDPEDAPGGQT